jgi:predicted transposase/invertase (TIGR01784 family)
LNTENLGKTETDRKAVFDLYCENEQGEKFIIELQNVSQAFFKDRSIYYATFPVQQQAPKGSDWDYYLKAVYTIGILNFVFPDRSPEERYVREVQLLDKQTFEVFYEKLTFIYLEMPRFKKKEEELVTHFDKWMYVLQNLPRLQERPQKLQEKIFEKLFSEAELAKLSPEDMRTYEESLKVYRDNKNAMDYAIKTAVDAAVAAAVEVTRKNERIELASKMKMKNMPIEQITEFTGLTREEIERL